MKILLASASPRRREILELIGMKPDWIIASDADETVAEGTSPEEMVQILAERKAKSVKEKAEKDVLIIASDTVVSLDGMILGKPKSRKDAFEMLTLLSGRTHTVYTGVCMLFGGQESIFYQSTDVAFYPLSEEEKWDYIDTGEPFDKAGAYGIQGRGAVLIREIHGDFFTVMGLPAAEVVRKARELTK